ncbi:MAG: response regulator transcription factor [Candidatus Sulfotelmatobacter sp.]
MRILIADDSEIVRRGLISILATQMDWEVCAEATNGSEAVRNARDLRPDLILLDVSMPGGMSGLEAARFIRQEAPTIKIIVISQNDAAQLLPHAIEAGADTCVDKGRLSTDLLASIRNISRPAMRL